MKTLPEIILIISGNRTYFGVEKNNVVIITMGCAKDQVILIIRGIDVFKSNSFMFNFERALSITS